MPTAHGNLANQMACFIFERAQSVCGESEVSEVEYERFLSMHKRRHCEYMAFGLTFMESLSTIRNVGVLSLKENFYFFSIRTNNVKNKFCSMHYSSYHVGIVV